MEFPRPRTGQSFPAVFARRFGLQAKLLVGLLGFTLAVFAGGLGHEFVDWDDGANIYRNPHLTGLAWKDLHWMFTDHRYASRYMPLGWLCYGAQLQAFGLNPHAFHAVNLALHLASLTLIFFFLKSLLAKVPSPRAPVAREERILWCAALGTLFWAVHPLRVESVAWASSVIYCAALFLALVSILAWWKARTSMVDGARRRLVYGWSVAAYAASLLTYPLALFLPAALIALEAYPLNRPGQGRADGGVPGLADRWRDKVPYFLVTAVILAVAVAARIGSDARLRATSLADFGLFPRVMQAFYILAYYGWKPWLPTDLAATYSTLHAFNPLAIKFALSAVFVLGMTILVVVRRRAWPAAPGLWFCHLAFLVPVLGLTEYPHAPYDRYSYFPGVLWTVGVAAILWRLWEHGRWAKLARVTVVLTSVVFGILAWQQTFIWRDTITLYQHAVACLGEHPSRARFDELLGKHYLLAGLTNEAIASLENAIVYESRRADRHIYDEGVWERSHLRLGEVFLSLHRPAEALPHYRAAFAKRPDAPGLPAIINSLAADLARERQTLPPPPGANATAAR